MTVTFPEDFLGQLSSSKSRSFFELRDPFMVGSVEETSLNKDQDLQQGDVLTSIDGNLLSILMNLRRWLQATKVKR